jgi:hypothetical protein
LKLKVSRGSFERESEGLRIAVEELTRRKDLLEEQLGLEKESLKKIQEQAQDTSFQMTAVRVMGFIAEKLYGPPAEGAATSDLKGRTEQQFESAIEAFKLKKPKAMAKKILDSAALFFQNAGEFEKHKRSIQQKIEEVLRKHIDYIFEEDPRKKAASLRQARSQTEEFMTFFRTDAFELIFKDEDGTQITVLEGAIKAAKIELTLEADKLKHERLITKYKPGQSIAGMELAKIESLYSECLKKDNKLKNLQRDLNKLVDRANLKELKSLYGINIEFTGKAGAPFQISSSHLGNVGMGYSIFSFLCDASIIPDGQEWNGEQTFTLTEDELNKLSAYLTKLDTWFDDFSKNVTGLLCVENVEEYVTAGQKQVYEILASAKRCTAEGRKVLSYSQANTPCLLLAQVGLNLESHPEREFIKEKLTKIYRQEEMKSLDGKYKQFVVGTYQTNLSAENVKQITPRLNKLLQFQRYLMEKSGQKSFKTAIEHFQQKRQTEFEMLKEYYVEKAIEAFGLFVTDPSSIRTQLKSQFTRIEADLNITSENFQTLDVSQIRSVDSLDKAYEEFGKAFLVRRTAPHFKKQAPGYAPSQEDIIKLYGTRRKRDYGDTKGVFGDLKQLFDSLKKSEAVKAVLEETPQIEAKLDGLRGALEDRLTTKYPLLKEHGWPSSKKLIRDAIDSLEIYVASVVNQRASRVSAESIKTSLAQIVGLDIKDLKDGCDEGLNGRILSLSIALSNNMADGIKAFMIQKQKELLGTACHEFVNGSDSYETSNSSHAPTYLVELTNYLGIDIRKDETQKTYETLSTQAKQMLQLFLKQYTPKHIYDTAKGFFEHSLWVKTLETNNEANRQDMYETLKELGFSQDEEELDKKYRIQGNAEEDWQYAFIKEDLPKYLPRYLIEKGLLVTMGDDAREGYLYWQTIGPLKSIDTAPPRAAPRAAAYVPPRQAVQPVRWDVPAPPIYYAF